MPSALFPVAGLPRRDTSTWPTVSSSSRKRFIWPAVALTGMFRVSWPLNVSVKLPSEWMGPWSTRTTCTSRTSWSLTHGRARTGHASDALTTPNEPLTISLVVTPWSQSTRSLPSRGSSTSSLGTSPT